MGSFGGSGGFGGSTGYGLRRGSDFGSKSNYKGRGKGGGEGEGRSTMLRVDEFKVGAGRRQEGLNIQRDLDSSFNRISLEADGLHRDRGGYWGQDRGAGKGYPMGGVWTIGDAVSGKKR